MNPPLGALRLFWGRTPASRGGEIRAASPASVFGRVEGDPQGFGAVTAGTSVRIERAKEKPRRPIAPRGRPGYAGARSRRAAP
jgi:hypothetical protein